MTGIYHENVHTVHVPPFVRHLFIYYLNESQAASMMGGEGLGGSEYREAERTGVSEREREVNRDREKEMGERPGEGEEVWGRAGSP